MSKSLEELYNSKQALNNIRFNYFENKRNEDANVEHFWFDTIKKELKALEIIKKYFWLEDFQDFISFNGCLPKSLKEEYDLLKEVLL